MKKLTKMIALAIGLVTVALTSCAPMLNNATISGEGVSTGTLITLYATSADDVIHFSPASSLNSNVDDARIIMPATIDASDDSKYKFWLWGTDKLDSSNTSYATPQKVTFTATTDSTTKGQVTLDLPVSQWELSLAVLPASATDPATPEAAKGAAILFATASVDFRSSDSVNFYLSPYKLSANGGYSLKIYTDGWTVPATHNVKIGLWPLDADDSVDTAIPAGTSIVTDTPPSTAPSTANFTSTSTTSVAPGTYNLIFKLIPTAASGLSKTYYWSDRIVILSNQVTGGEIAIPYIVDALPADPEALGVGYIDPLTSTADTYEVEFTWTDKSYNESNFQLEILDFTNLAQTDENTLSTSLTALAGATGASGTALDTAWDTIFADTYKPSEELWTIGKQLLQGTGATPTKLGYFYNNERMWVDGSLNKNSKYAVVKLQLGHRYFARLCAINDVGKSKYLYADIAGTTVTSLQPYKRFASDLTGNAVTAAEIKAFGEDTKAINRFRITYNLNEGSFYEKDGSDAKKLKDPKTALNNIKDINTTKTAIVVYGSQKSTDQITVLNPLHAPSSDTSPKYGLLLNGDNNKWTNWLVASTSGSIFDPSKDYFSNAKFDDAADADWTEEDYTYSVTTGTGSSTTTTAYNSYKNIDLYATYRVTTGNAQVDPSSNYKITDGMVKVFYNITNTFPTTPTAATKTNGIYTFVNSTTDDENAGSEAKPAKFLYVCLVNDGANNYVNGTPVSYNKVEMMVLKNGNIPKQTSTASTTSTTIAFTGTKADGTASSEASASYVTIPIATYEAGKYAVQIHAYANTQQAEYTYTLYFEVRDPS